MVENSSVELEPTGSNVEDFIGTTDVAPLVSTQTAVSKPFSINKVILTPEMMATARELFPEKKQEALDKGEMDFPRTPGGFLANDLVDTFRVDFADRIAEDPNYLTYEGLRNGTATILDDIKTYAGKKPKQRVLTDDDIAKIFSNAEDAPLARAFFGELAKTLPALQAGMSTTALTAGALFSQMPIAKTPAGLGIEYLGKSAVALGTGVVAGFGVYSAVDAVEEGFFGPDPVVVPGQRAAYEAFRTLGGGAANIAFPFMLSRYGVDSGARFILDNFGKNIRSSLGLRIQASLDEMLSGTARLATGSRTGAITTVLAEAGGAGGAGGAAYLAETGNVGTGGRLFSEFIGGNIGALTVLKALPKAMTSLTNAGGVSGITETIGNKQQKKVFGKVNQLIQDFGDESQYETLLDNLTSPAFIREMQEAFPGVNFSAGQQTGDPLLMALEASRTGSVQSDLTKGRAKASKKAYAAINNFMEILTEEGSEASLNAAAELRKSLFEEIVENNVAVPINNLLEAAKRLRSLPTVDGDPTLASTSAAMLSEKLNGVIENQIFKLMAAKEKNLYNLAGARDHAVFDLSDGNIPEFIKVYDELAYLNKGLQQEFERSMPGIANFVKQAKRDLGIDVEGGADFDLTDLQFEVDQAKTILSKYVPEDTEILTTTGTTLTTPDLEDYNSALLKLKERFKEEGFSFEEQAETLKNAAKRQFEEKNNRFTTDFTDKQKNARNAYGNALMAEGRLAEAKAAGGMVQGEEPVALTAASIDEIRSRSLALAREFTNGLTPSKSDYGRRLGIFANSLRESLEAAEGGAPIAYRNAVAFTRAKHDVISRMVNGKVAATSGTGQRMVDPLVTLSTYITANPSVTLSRTRQLQAMAQFADDQNLAEFAAEKGVAIAADPVFTTVNNLTEAYLRRTQMEAKVITRSFNSVTNKPEVRINDDALAKWRDENADLLEAFPQLKKDTQDAETFQRSLEFKESRRDRLNYKAFVQARLGNLLKGRSPTVAVGEAFEASEPALAFKNLFNIQRVAMDSGPSRVKFSRGDNVLSRKLTRIKEAGLKVDEVNEGFRTAILQQAMMRAGGEIGGADKTFDPKTFHTFLFKPMGKSGKVSLADLAVKNGVFSEGQIKRLKFMSTQMVRVQAADAAGKLKDPKFVDEAGAIVDFYYGVVGSALGSAAYTGTSSLLPIQGSAGQLAASSAGARYIRTVMDSIPALQNLDTLDQALMDPELVSKLIRKPTNAKDAERQRFAVGNHLREMFFKKGVEMTPFVARETFEEDDNTMDAPYLGFPGIPENSEKNRQGYIDRIRRNLPPNDQQGAVAPVQRPSPVETPTTQARAVPSPDPVPVNSGPVDRTRYAALFPNDSISGMMQAAHGGEAKKMRRGGIASLMR